MRKYRKIILILFLISISTVSFEAERVFSAEEKEADSLQVVENKLYEGDREIRFEGVNIPSLEWDAGGNNMFRSFEVALNEWGANVIRLPVSQDFWFGEARAAWNRNQLDEDGENYRELIDDLIAMVTERDKYIIIDLHGFVAPDPRSEEFWASAAARYKNHSNVLFGIYNEPFNVSWDVWKNGGVETDYDETDDAFSMHKEDGSFDSPGHQGIVDTIREQGARNIIVAGGLDWGYDLSVIAEGYALEDSEDSRGIIYDAHKYPWKTEYATRKEEAIDVINEEYPILIGEWGIFEGDRDEFGYDYGEWVSYIFDWIHENEYHWTAWCFHHETGPQMLKNLSDYEPTEFWGVFVKEELQDR